MMIPKRYTFAPLAALVLSLNLACTPKEQSTPEPIKAAVVFDTQQTMAELMLWVIDPAADTIWDSVSWISNEKGTKANAPKTEEDWKALKIQASILVESANLLMRNLEPVLRDLREFSDKVARNPEVLGLGGAVRPSTGLKDAELRSTTPRSTPAPKTVVRGNNSPSSSPR